MIKKLSLKFGSSPRQNPLSIDVGSVTVFVGPNNSGKSLILRELDQYCRTGKPESERFVFDILEFEAFTLEVANERIDQMQLSRKSNENVPEGNVLVGKLGQRNNIGRAQLLEWMLNPNKHGPFFCRYYMSSNTLKLDGAIRMNLINSQTRGDALETPATSFQVLFNDDKKRHEARRICHDAFQHYLVVDPTNGDQLRLRLSRRVPASNAEEQGLHSEAREFHKSAQAVADMGDGVKAFTGMIVETIAGDPEVLLIDEPEAFLHPSLSFKLGKELSLASSKSGKRLFVSTHSPGFVMGCIQSGVDVNIVRLTYDGNIATARLLSSEELRPLMREPLLRSTRVIEALFYESVVIGEGDSDRAFYQEINERLLQFGEGKGISNCLFLNAFGWQSIHKILGPLRRLGIPVATVIDIDVIKGHGNAWRTLLVSGEYPQTELNSIAQARGDIKTAFSELDTEDKKMNKMKEEGVALLSGEVKEAANNLFDRLDEYGLFVVRIGELESWLPKLEVENRESKSDWLISAFEKMESDPDSENYLKPDEELTDVWAFLESVKMWLKNPARKGIPD